MLRCFAFAFGLLLTAVPFLTAQDKVAPFTLNISSKVNMDAEGKQQVIDASTALAYRWTVKPTERALNYDSTQVQVKIDGMSTLDMLLSRDKIVSGSGEQKKETVFAACREEQQKMLKDSFGAPLCKLVVDANGLESKREIVAGEGAKVQIDNGMIANAVLFHAPFYAEKKEWEADREISMGNGGFAKGKLRYWQIEGKTPPTVAVSGKLANAKHKLPGGPLVITDATYDFSGEQSFDPAVGEWTAGKLTIEMTFQIVSEEKKDDVKKIGSAKGTMTQTLEYKTQP